MALDHSRQVQRHPLAERGHDLYETPDVAVEALLRVERLPHRIWESSNPETIIAWWTQWPNAWIALLCGCGFVAVDVDTGQAP
jgi:hypothetical protein